MWIGIDDTDSRLGGCTTYLCAMTISYLQDLKIHLIGFPRLVRLNPNVPWKTRGNGAVSFQIGVGKGEPVRIGRINGEDIFSYSSCKKEQWSDLRINNIKDVLVEKINSMARLSEDNTNPGLVSVSNQFDETIYWKTVQTLVDKKDIITYIEKQNGWFQEFKNGRGIIGATASIAWRGTHDITYELIAYREKNKWGSKRFVNGRSVMTMDKLSPSTFDNYDYENKHINIIPNSPCPVLFGIRGNNPNELSESITLLETESFNDWIIFASNQGTDDHLLSCDIKNVKAFQSVIITGIVNSKPVTIPGGHVIFSICDKENHCIDCAAYEPTKQFRQIIRYLRPGDLVKVFGGIRDEPFSINLEKIQILHLTESKVKIENPVCPLCGKHMKSIGKNQGFRCKKCGTKTQDGVLKHEKRPISEIMYEVPVCARRHLSKPLKRI